MSPPDGPRPPSHGVWIVLLILLIGAAGAAAAFLWHQRSRDPFRGALAVSPEEFLQCKRQKLLKEVWVYGNGEIVAETTHGFVRGEKAYSRIWTVFLPIQPQDAAALKTLAEGVDPAKFHYAPER